MFGDLLNLPRSSAFTEQKWRLTGTAVLAMESASKYVLSPYLTGLKPKGIPCQRKNQTLPEKATAYSA